MVRDHQQTASAALPQFAHDRRAQEVVAWREAEIKEHLGQRSAGRVKAGSEDKDLDPVPEIFPQIANGSAYPPGRCLSDKYCNSKHPTDYLRLAIQDAGPYPIALHLQQITSY